MELRYISKALIWLGFFSAIILSWYFYLKNRHRERMALIEKGIDVSEVYKPREVGKFPWMKVGIFIIAIGLAFGTTMVLFSIVPELVDDVGGEFILLGTILLFGGIALILPNLPGKKHSK